MEENASPPPSPVLEIFPDLPQPLVKRRAGGVEGGVCVWRWGDTTSTLRTTWIIENVHDISDSLILLLAQQMHI